MKKRNFFMAFAAMALVLTGCGKDKDEKTAQEKLDETVLKVDMDWRAAKYAEGVGQDFELTNEHLGVKVTYTSDKPEFISISEDNKKATVTRPAETAKDEIVTLTANFSIEKLTETKTLKALVLKMPKSVDLMTIEQFQATKTGDMTCVEGIVIARTPVNTQYKNFDAYLQNETAGGFSVRAVPESYDAMFKDGNQIRVTGNKDVYSGLHQVSAMSDYAANFKATLVAEDKTLPAHKNITDDIKNVKDGDLSNMPSLLQGTRLEINDFVVIKIPAVEIVDGVIKGSINVEGRVGSVGLIVRLDKSFTSVELMNKFQGYKPNDVLTIKSVGGCYNVFQVQALEVEKTGVKEYTDEELVNLAMDGFKFSITETVADFKLPLTADNGVTVSWSSNNAAIAVNGEDAKVTRGEADVTVTLTATFKLNEVVATKTYEVVVGKIAATDTDGEIVFQMKGFANITEPGYQYTEQVAEFDGVSFAATGFMGDKGTIRGNKTAAVGQDSNFSIYNSTAVPGAITKIEVICASNTADGPKFSNCIKAAVGTTSQSAVTTDDGAKTGTFTDTTMTLEFDEAEGITFFRLLSNENFTSGSCVDAQIKITYVPAA